MNINLPVFDYYPKGDEYFMDPLYAPYARDLVETKDGLCEVNMWKKQGYPDGFVNPALVRKGWGMDFQLLHPDKDPAPLGWTKGVDGWCVENKPEFEGTFYTPDAFVAAYQYWGSYAPRLQNPMHKLINQFDMRSVSPWTGNYVTYFNSYPSTMRVKYGHLPSKDSYLA